MSISIVQKLNREERIYICQAEKVPDEEIKKILEVYPALYGTEETK